MKSLALISFTKRGAKLCGQLNKALSVHGFCCEAYALPKYAGEFELRSMELSLGEWAGEMFERMDGILFIGAAGIAVRSIAPFLQGKAKDPAVVVMDEKGMFAISLLCGHLGGANELAGILSNLTGAIPVITTATDVNGRFAVDLFAKKQNLYISSMTCAKCLSADILDEKPVGFVSEFPILGEVPEELHSMEAKEPFDGECGIVLSLNEECRPFKQTLHLIPRIVTVGIGCRKGTEKEKIRSVVLNVLRQNHISRFAVEQLASIDLKAEEPGICALAREWKLDFHTYTSGELNEVEGEFTKSQFVSQVTGVDNVCERSAIKASLGELIQKKKGEDGVTVALAVRKWSVDFE